VNLSLGLGLGLLEIDEDGQLGGGVELGREGGEGGSCESDMLRDEDM